MKPDDLQLALRLHEDNTRLIAAGKVQRWEVVKWTVALNIALATASASANFDSFSRLLILALAVVTAAFGGLLLCHYNARITNVRDEKLRNINRYLRDNGLDPKAVTNTEWDAPKGDRYDWQEMIIFYLAVGLSVIPSIVAWLVV